MINNLTSQNGVNNSKSAENQNTKKRLDELEQSIDTINGKLAETEITKEKVNTVDLNATGTSNLNYINGFSIAVDDVSATNVNTSDTVSTPKIGSPTDALIVTSDVEAENIKAKSIKAESIELDNTEISSLKTDNFQANTITVSDKITTSEIESTAATIENANISCANISHASITNLDDIDATTARIDNLESENIETDEIKATVGTVDTLTSKDITSDKVTVDEATVSIINNAFNKIPLADNKISLPALSVENWIGFRLSLKDGIYNFKLVDVDGHKDKFNETLRYASWSVIVNQVGNDNLDHEGKPVQQANVLVSFAQSDLGNLAEIAFDKYNRYLFVKLTQSGDLYYSYQSEEVPEFDYSLNQYKDADEDYLVTKTTDTYQKTIIVGDNSRQYGLDIMGELYPEIFRFTGGATFPTLTVLGCFTDEGNTLICGCLDTIGSIESETSVKAPVGTFDEVETNDLHVNDDVVIHGDLYVEGTTVTHNEQQVSTSGDYLLTRENNNSPLGAGEYSGLVVNNYATGKMATITVDGEGVWRISDSATEASTTLTDISLYNGVYYEGLTKTESENKPGRLITNLVGDELSEAAYYNNKYYHFDGKDWFGPITVDSTKHILHQGDKVEDDLVIDALNELDRYDLVYYFSITTSEIDNSENVALAAREDNPNDTSFAYWDGETKTFKTDPEIYRPSAGTVCMTTGCAENAYICNSTVNRATVDNETINCVANINVACICEANIDTSTVCCEVIDTLNATDATICNANVTNDVTVCHDLKVNNDVTVTGDVSSDSITSNTLNTTTATVCGNACVACNLNVTGATTTGSLTGTTINTTGDITATGSLNSSDITATGSILACCDLCVCGTIYGCMCSAAPQVVVANNASNTNYVVPFLSTGTGCALVYSDSSGMSYNPSTNRLYISGGCLVVANGSWFSQVGGNSSSHMLLSNAHGSEIGLLLAHDQNWTGTSYCTLGIGVGSGNVNRGLFHCKGGNFEWLQYWDGSDTEVHTKKLYVQQTSSYNCMCLLQVCCLIACCSISTNGSIKGSYLPNSGCNTIVGCQTFSLFCNITTNATNNNVILGLTCHRTGRCNAACVNNNAGGTACGCILFAYRLTDGLNLVGAFYDARIDGGNDYCFPSGYCLFCCRPMVFVTHGGGSGLGICDVYSVTRTGFSIDTWNGSAVKRPFNILAIGY